MVVTGKNITIEQDHLLGIGMEMEDNSRQLRTKGRPLYAGFTPFDGK